MKLKTVHQRIEVIRPRTVRGAEGLMDAATPESVSRRITPAFDGELGAASPADVIRSTIRLIVEVGGDVGQPAKGAVLGILRGTEVTGGATLDAIRATADSVIRFTAEAAGDVARAALGTVEGSIQGARELDLDVFESATAAAHAALRAARDVGAESASRVLRALNGNIAGVQMAMGGSYAHN